MLLQKIRKRICNVFLISILSPNVILEIEYLDKMICYPQSEIRLIVPVHVNPVPNKSFGN